MFRKPSIKGKKIIEETSDYEAKEENIEIRILPKKRFRGLSATEEFKEEEKSEKNSLEKKFVQSRSQIQKIRENHLENYIKETLNVEQQSLTKKCESFEDFLYQIPEKYKTDNSRITEGSEKTLWLTGLVEVPLSIEHKLDNIEATEAAKRRGIKEYSAEGSRFEGLHEEEYERFNERLNQQRNNEKIVERLEKKMVLRGKKYKIDKEERIKNNQNFEKICQDELKKTILKE